MTPFPIGNTSHDELWVWLSPAPTSIIEYGYRHIVSSARSQRKDDLE